METLGERLARGAESAFAELFEACADRVHHYLVVRLGSRTDADDVLQETFLRLVRTRAKLAAVENLMAYVFTVARNEVVRTAERRTRDDQRRVALSVDDLFCQDASSGNLASETSEWVTAMLNHLVPELREIVELKIYGGLTIREISEVTKLPQGTVATRYRRALEAMRGLMAREWK